MFVTVSDCETGGVFLCGSGGGGGIKKKKKNFNILLGSIHKVRL